MRITAFARPGLAPVGLTLFALVAAHAATAQQSRSYGDGKKGEVTLPMGDLSFADAVISHQPGSGRIETSAADPRVTLGPPDFSGNVDDGSFLSLGCDGEVVLHFTDNALVDVPGPDLYVFEVGPKVEGMRLAISVDGQTWTEVGEIEGGRADVDIAGTAEPGESYRYLRLTDDGQDCGTRFAGADVDAVAAIGSAMRFVLDGEVLFALDSSELRPEARAALDDLAGEIAAAGLQRIKVVGHTDSSGSEVYNLALSEARALAVRDHLAALAPLAEVEIGASGRGEAEPIADNTTEAGRRMNRRVEIIGGSGG